MVAGEWVHVVGVYDSNVPSILLYLDGELVDTTAEGVSSTGYGNTLELAIAGTGGSPKGLGRSSR